MKFAIVEGERQEAQPSLLAKCPGCSNEMIAKCGQERIWHWAHRMARTCDHFWESETEWHRAWKNQFPKDWQEIVAVAKDGEKHIADVKTESGIVLEFQHSFLSRDEREAREIFYKNMVWVVDGRRRPLDKLRFFQSLGKAIFISRKLPIVAVQSSACALLRDWQSSRVPVYFDFGDSEADDLLRYDEPMLWRLNPGNDRAYLSPVTKAAFLQVHMTGQPFDEMFSKVFDAVTQDLLRRARHAQPLTGFGRYMDRNQRSRRRF